MKRIVKSIALLGIAFSLFSCSSSSSSSSLVDEENSFDNKTPINLLKSDTSSSFTSISSSSLEDLVTYSSSSSSCDFVLFIYQAGCSGCSKMKEYLLSLTSEEHYIIYGITYSNYNSVYQEKGEPNYIPVTLTPTILFFSLGKPVGRLIGAPTTYSTFKEAFINMVKPGNIYTLNTLTEKTGSDGESDYKYDSYNEEDDSYLDSFIKSEDEVNVIFTWKKCSDCISLKDDWLLDFAKNNINKKFYLFEVNYYRTPTEEGNINPNWALFASKYGLSNFSTGKVPSIVTYKKGVFSSMIVYHNEGEATLNSDNTYSYLSAYNDEVKAIKASSKDELSTLAQTKELELLQALYSK